MTVRFLHTADWQLGYTPTHLGEQASRAGEIRFRTAERVVELAEEEEVDFVVVAGDTFESENIGGAAVERVVETLETLAPTPVYLLPGNHDPIRPGGLWGAVEWKNAGDHIHLLDEREKVQVEGADDVVLYPSPITQNQSRQDPTDWIPERTEGDNRVRIGVAHGALDVLADDSPDFPIDPERADKTGLDYLALGDWHGLMVEDRTAYPGTIEQSSFGEDDPGHVLLVEVDSDRDDLELEQSSVGRLTWIDLEEKLVDETDLRAIRLQLEDTGEPADLVARLELEAAHGAEPALSDAVAELDEDLGSQAYHWDLNFDPSALYEERELDIPDGLVSEVNEDLDAIADKRIPDGPGNDFAGEDAEIVEEARRLLFDIVDDHHSSSRTDSRRHRPNSSRSTRPTSWPTDDSLCSPDSETRRRNAGTSPKTSSRWVTRNSRSNSPTPESASQIWRATWRISKSSSRNYGVRKPMWPVNSRKSRVTWPSCVPTETTNRSDAARFWTITARGTDSRSTSMPASENCRI